MSFSQGSFPIMSVVWCLLRTAGVFYFAVVQLLNCVLSISLGSPGPGCYVTTSIVRYVPRLWCFKHLFYTSK